VEKLQGAQLEWAVGSSAGQIINSINNKGYEVLFAGNPEIALELFKANTMLFPDNFNVWDSLAECYYNLKKYDLSLEYYEKSIELNPENDNGKQMIERVKAAMSD
jgi:tetratricopeptide (TPR) repeat protein